MKEKIVMKIQNTYTKEFLPHFILYIPFLKDIFQFTILIHK